MTRTVTKRFAALTAFSILFVGLAWLYSADPPQGSLRLTIEFMKSKGLLDYYDSASIPDDTAQIVQNLEFIQNMKPRKGLKNETSDSIGAAGTHYGHYVEIFISTTNKKYAIYNRGGQIFNQDIATTDPGWITGLSPTSEIDGISWNGNFYITGGMVPGKLYETLTTSSLSVLNVPSIPQGKYFQSHLNRLLLANTTDSAMIIHYSQEDEPENFPATNTIELISLNSGDKITGMGQDLFGNLPVYTNNTSRIIYGTEYPDSGVGGNIKTRIIATDIGCIHHRTIKTMNGKQYFYSVGPNGTIPGIYVNNGISVKEVTKGQREFFKTLNISTTPIPNAYIYKDSYCLNVATKNGNVNNTFFCIDDNNRVRHGKWALGAKEPIGIDMVAVYQNITRAINGNPFIVGGFHSSMWSIDANVSKDDNNGYLIDWKYKTKDFDMGEKAKQKTAWGGILHYLYYPSTFAVSAIYDMGRSTKTWIVNSTTNYQNTSQGLYTLKISSHHVATKLVFPEGIDKKFNYIGFEFFGSTYTALDQFDFYSYPPEPMK